jgi:tripartite-type tricarboxylate transporter receptor subunit TctC
MTGWNRLIAALALLGLSLAAPIAAAQDFPTKPLRLVIGFPAGASGDLAMRMVGGPLGQALGQQIVIENRPGASSSIAAEATARAPKDGYTLFLGTVANVVNAAIQPKLPFDFAKDFAPVALMATVPVMLVVHPSIGVNSVAELIALAKAKPGGLFYASSGIATTPHLAGALLNVRANINIVHVPYQGATPAITDLLGGRTQVMFSSASTVMPHVNTGKLKALAWAAPQRSGIAPNLPTMAEVGLPDLDASIWLGLMVPAGTPPAVIDKLGRAVNQVLKSQELLANFKKHGYEPLGGSPADFTRYVEREMIKWKTAAEVAGVRK